jgi:hypothetical protein
MVYRCMITDAEGSKVISNTVQIVTALAISTQPADAAVLAGDKVTFSVKVSNGEAPYTYQWMVRSSASAWADLTNGGRFSGVDTAQLEITVDQSDFTKNQFCCVIKDAAGNDVTTTTAYLREAFHIVSQPTSVHAEKWDSVSFTVEVAGGKEPYTYQWMNAAHKVCGKDEPTFTRGADEYILDQDNEWYHYCIITDMDGNQLVTDKVTAYDDGVVFGMQPESLAAREGDVVEFSAMAHGGAWTKYTYRWQWKPSWNSALDWTDVDDDSRYSFTVNAMFAQYPSYYRCIATDANGNSVTSNVVTLNGLDVNLDTDSFVLDIDETRTVRVSSCTGGTSSLRYTWYLWNPNTRTWYTNGSWGNSYSFSWRSDGLTQKTYCQVWDSNKLTGVSEIIEIHSQRKY